MNGVEHKDGKGSQDSNKKRYVVPENYLEANVEDIIGDWHRALENSMSRGGWR